MRRLVLLAVALAVAASAAALDTSTRPVGPVVDWNAAALARFDPQWVHLKFVEGSHVTFAGGAFRDAAGQTLTGVNDVLANALAVRRTFAGEADHLRDLKHQGELASGRPGPDLSLWYDVKLPAGRANLADVINALNARPEVEIAHPAPICDLAVVMPEVAPAPLAPLPPTPDFTAQQTYLGAPPLGLNAQAIWDRAGGRGAGIKFIDCELAWVWNHEDFNPLAQFYQGGIGTSTLDYRNHGTAVLGEIMGRNNGFGVTGFASDITWGTVGITEDEWPDVPQYFQEAIDHLSPGDAWLIELQMYPPGRSATPMEWLQVNFDVIWTGCWAQNVVCIEAGANGTQNLDEASWGGVFDRNVRDSGAIMVAAGTPTGRVAEWFTNWGSRMDVHAWGSAIVTTGYGDLYNGGSEATYYTSGFGGTSGASPMITGSSLCLEGIAQANLGVRLAPSELRQLLHDTGVPHLDPTKEIGPRPDLAAAVDQLLALTPVTEPAVASGLRILGAISPFSGTTEIRFAQPRAGDVRLNVYDLAGRRVRSLASDATGIARWDGRDATGADVGSGVYLYRLTAGSETATGRLVKVR